VEVAVRVAVAVDVLVGSDVADGVAFDASITIRGCGLAGDATLGDAIRVAVSGDGTGEAELEDARCDEAAGVASGAAVLGDDSRMLLPIAAADDAGERLGDAIAEGVTWMLMIAEAEPSGLASGASLVEAAGAEVIDGVVASGTAVGAAIGAGLSPPPARLPISTPSRRLAASAAEIKIRRVRSTPPFISLLGNTLWQFWQRRAGVA
jgi:hypothetical protein